MKLVKVFLRLLHIHSLILLRHSWFRLVNICVFLYIVLLVVWRLRVIFFCEIFQAPLPGISSKPLILWYQALIPVLSWRRQWKVFRYIFFPWPRHWGLQWSRHGIKNNIRLCYFSSILFYKYSNMWPHSVSKTRRIHLAAYGGLLDIQTRFSQPFFSSAITPTPTLLCRQ